MKHEENKLNYGLISKYRPVLMGVAILLILFCHLQNGQNSHGLPHTHLAGILQTGSVGVDIFLLLSGVGLYYSYTKNPMPYWSFEKKRLRRILPYYFILAAVTYLIDDVFIRRLGFGRFFRDLFFITWFLEGSTKYWYVLAICVFYLLFPLIYSHIQNQNKNTLKIVLFCVLWWAAEEALCHFVDAISTFRIALARLPIFVAGVYAGKLSYEKKAVRGLHIVLFVLVGFLLLAAQKRIFPRSWISFLHYPIRGALAVSLVTTVVLGMHALEEVVPTVQGAIAAVLGWFGGLTYELYLLHQSYRIVLNYPGDYLGYFVSAFLLPTITAAGIYWIRKALKKRRAHESIQHL